MLSQALIDAVAAAVAYGETVPREQVTRWSTELATGSGRRRHKLEPLYATNSAEARRLMAMVKGAVVEAAKLPRELCGLCVFFMRNTIPQNFVDYAFMEVEIQPHTKTPYLHNITNALRDWRITPCPNFGEHHPFLLAGGPAQQLEALLKGTHYAVWSYNLTTHNRKCLEQTDSLTRSEHVCPIVQFANVSDAVYARLAAN